ncbi:MAG TPA: TonB family protein [Terriglobales bacterium]|nr:TonB family protein [Terriglobales bacterium]
MFAELRRPERKLWNPCVLASFGLHCAVLLFLIHRTAPVFVTPSDVDHGIPGSSGSLSIVYLAPVGPEQSNSTPEEPRPTLRAAVAPMPKAPKPQFKPSKTDQPTQQNAPEQTARGGSPWGRVPGSPVTGDEVVPALPEVFPDPPVARSDLPSGVEGDVIVEVTIDAQGNVVGTKLLQGIGYGIEQKVLAVLQRWHFRPARRDGVTIVSQHIVHFHYPA